MPDVAAGTSHAAKAVGSEVVDLVIDYLVPIGTGLAGFAMGQALFGGSEISTQLTNASSQMGISSATASRVTGVFLGVILGLVGYAFWRLGKRDGWVMHLVGKGFGAFFLGTGARYALDQALLGKAVPAGGIIGAFVSGAQQIAGGG